MTETVPNASPIAKIPATIIEPNGDTEVRTVNFRPLPKISCLMVTRGNLFPARYAIDSFLSQSYSNCELIVVCATPDNSVARYLSALRSPRIKYFAAALPTLGELRNHSVDMASGEYLCIWDDDDLYHPYRVELMFTALRASNAGAAFLNQIMLWWPRRRSLCFSASRLWEGSMLVERAIMPRYPARTREEDTPVVEELHKKHRLIAVQAPFAYCYVATGQNTWDASHFERMYASAVVQLSGEKYNAHFETLRTTLPVEAYERELFAVA